MPCHDKGISVLIDARTIPDHAEPVEAGDLKEGLIYFAVQYMDSRMRVPQVEALVFLGRNLVPGDVGQFYFQDAGSHREGVRFGAPASNQDPAATFYQQHEKELKHIFEFDRALDELLRCSSRRTTERRSTTKQE
jgi:hypothetical protein